MQMILAKSKSLWNKTWFKLALFTGILLLCIYLYPIISRGHVGMDYGDGTYQYRIFMRSFIEKIKTNNFSFLDMNSYYGTSIFSLEYYLPLDIFTLLILLLSYIMDFSYAFYLVKMILVFTGVMLFYIMARITFKFSEKTSFVISLMYLTCGSISVFLVYYTFAEMYVYVPLLMMTLFYAHNQKKYIPLLFMTIVLMFYNFYLGYVIVAGSFLSLVFINFINKKEKVSLKQHFKSEIKLLLLDVIPILLGVITSAVIVLPSILYLLNYSSMDRPSTSFNLLHYFNLFSQILFPSGEVVFLKNNNDYITEQLSLYISVFGLLSIINLVLSNKKNRKKYLIIFAIEAVMVCVPIFSQIFSASLSPYTRWFFSISIVNIFIAGINFEQDGYKLTNINKKWKSIIFITYLFVGTLLFILYPDMKTYNTFVFLLIVFLTILLLIGILRLNLLRKWFFYIFTIFATCTMFIRTMTANMQELMGSEKNIQNSIVYLNQITNNDLLYRTYIYQESNVDTNINALTDNMTNEGIMFASFYNIEIKTYIQNYLGFLNKAWSQYNVQERNINSMKFSGYKYVLIENKNNVVIPSYLKYIDSTDSFKIYENTLVDGFATVYYNSTNELSDNIIYNQTLLNHIVYYESANDTILEPFKFEYIIYEATETKIIDNIKYNVLDMSILKNDKCYSSLSSNILLLDDEGNEIKLFDNTFIMTKDIKQILYFNKFSGSDIELYEFDYEDYEASLPTEMAEQIDVVKNKDTFTMTYNKQESKECVIVLPITYSKEYVSKYEIVKANGGFVGLIIPENEIGELEIEVTFMPNGVSLGATISVIGMLCSNMFVAYQLYLGFKRKETYQLY